LPNAPVSPQERIRVVFLTDVAGVYDRAPHLPGATLIRRVLVHPDGTVRNFVNAVLALVSLAHHMQTIRCYADGLQRQHRGGRARRDRGNRGQSQGTVTTLIATDVYSWSRSGSRIVHTTILLLLLTAVV
jgi:hypothetical protein